MRSFNEVLTRVMVPERKIVHSPSPFLFEKLTWASNVSAKVILAAYLIFQSFVCGREGLVKYTLDWSL